MDVASARVSPVVRYGAPNGAGCGIAAPSCRGSEAPWCTPSGDRC